VTGAGRGIGLAIAKELATLGARVLLVGRKLEPLLALESDIKSNGGLAKAIAADVCETRWLECLIENNGNNKNSESIDILVHSAASFASFGPLEQCSNEEITSVIDTNLIAALRMSALLLPGMKARNYGMLLFLGSQVASLGAANQVIYASAKAGLSGLVKSIVAENTHSGVNAHLIELGLIDTERTQESVSEKARTRLVKKTPAGRIGEPKDVAAAVRYLLSPDSSFLRGITLPVSGGIGIGITS